MHGQQTINRLNDAAAAEQVRLNFLKNGKHVVEVKAPDGTLILQRAYATADEAAAVARLEGFTAKAHAPA